MRKAYLVYFRPRGNNYAFSRLDCIKVFAYDKKEARWEATSQIGDCYRIMKVEEA